MLALFILIVVMAEMNSRRPYVTPTNNHVLNDVLRKSMSDRRRNDRDGGGFGGGFGGGGFGGGSGGGFGGGGFDGGGAGGSW